MTQVLLASIKLISDHAGGVGFLIFITIIAWANTRR